MKRYNVNIKCGTYGGYQLHYRRKEPVCEPCKKAGYEYLKKYQKHSVKRQEMKNIQKARRRARLKNSITESYTLAQIFITYGYACYLCNKPIDMSAPRQSGKPGWKLGLHIDHVIDIQYGGSDTLENVRPTHGICNLRKNARKAPAQD